MKCENNTQVVCNKCGRGIEIKNDIPAEDYVNIHKEWGYFSKKDRTTVDFKLCEDCFDEIVNGLVIPAKIEETTELL